MNETLQDVNATDTAVRMGRDLQNPLLNLILAASLLSKLTSGKSHLKAWPSQQYRPSVYGQLPQQQEPLYFYPYDVQNYNRLYTSLNANQANFPIKQHIIHIHQTPTINKEPDNGEDAIDDKKTPDLSTNSSNEESQSTNQFNVEENLHQDDKNNSNSSDENANENTTLNTDVNDDNMEPLMAMPTNNLSDELKDFLIQLFKKNFTLPMIVRTDAENEIPEPDQLFGKTEATTTTTVPINIEEPDIETTMIPDIEVAESSVDLQAAEANIKRRTESPKDYDYSFARLEEDDEDEDDEDLVEVTLSQQKLRLKGTTEAPASKRHPQRPRVQATRINSKKPSQSKPKRTTPITLIYDDEDYDATTIAPRRKTSGQNGQKRTNIQRRTTTTPSTYDFEDDYEEPKRKRLTTRRRHTTSTAPTYDDYDSGNTKGKAGNKRGNNKNKHNDEYYQEYNQYDQYDQDDKNIQFYNNAPKRKNSFQERQIDTTPAITTDITDTTFETTLMSSTSTTTMAPVANVTSGPGEYPYYGNNNNDHISITYGPPVHHYPGYGPSNGNNDQISITYAPPSGSNSGQLDNWYNQYAKASMFQRIQDLLTPNNYYNQYDINYNDNQ